MVSRDGTRELAESSRRFVLTVARIALEDPARPEWKVDVARHLAARLHVGDAFADGVVDADPRREPAADLEPIELYRAIIAAVAAAGRVEDEDASLARGIGRLLEIPEAIHLQVLAEVKGASATCRSAERDPQSGEPSQPPVSPVSPPGLTAAAAEASLPPPATPPARPRSRPSARLRAAPAEAIPERNRTGRRVGAAACGLALAFGGGLAAWNLRSGSPAEPAAILASSGSAPSAVDRAPTVARPSVAAAQGSTVSAPNPPAQSDRTWAIKNGDIKGGRRATPGPTMSHGARIKALAMSADARVLVSVGGEKLNVWELPAGRLLRGLSCGAGTCDAVALSRDGRLMVIAGSDGRVAIHSLPEAKVIRTTGSHGAPVQAIAVAPDATWMATAGRDARIKLWKLPEGTETRTLLGHNFPVMALAGSLDGRTLASRALDGTTILWSLPEGTIRKTIDPSGGRGWAMAMSLNGEVILHGGYSDSLVTAIATDAITRLPAVHTNTVVTAALSTDGKVAVSGSKDGSIVCWDISAGQPLATITGHADGVDAVTMDREGSTVASADPDGAIAVWLLR